MNDNYFKKSIERLNEIGIIQVSTDFYMEPNKQMFVRSPKTPDKHASLKLYPLSNSFCDFANGDFGGDIIQFISYVRGVNNWDGLKLLQDFYQLHDDEKQSYEEVQRRIRIQAALKRDEERKKQSWRNEVDRLQEQIRVYDNLLNSDHIPPFSDVWRFCIEQKQLAEYELDVLCGVYN